MKVIYCLNQGLLRPSGRIRLDCIHRVGNCLGRRQREQQMHVIRRPADGDGLPADVAGHAGQVRVQAGEIVLRDQIRSSLRREHRVVVKTRERVRHGGRPLCRPSRA